jgi:hypothetical protein
VRSSVAAREASRRVYLRHGSRKGQAFRGAEAEARYRQSLLVKSPNPGLERPIGLVQQELFGSTPEDSGPESSPRIGVR